MKLLPCAPEFCPRVGCRFHDRETASAHQWYDRFGTFETRCRGPIQRFRCRECGKTCSTQTFSVHYWTHSTGNLVRLLELFYTCAGMRQIGRMTGVTHRVVQNRYRRLARNALAVMDEVLAGLELDEDLAFDGFESYTRSQYHPNNITHIAGSDSQFVYAAVHSLLRRKGSMTKPQKRQRALIDSVWSAKTTLAEQCSLMFRDLAPVIDAGCETRPDGVTLHSDFHPSYPGAIRSSVLLTRRLKEGTLTHRRTSSRAARTTSNPLFPSNYVDRQLRKNLAEHVRETVRQGREVNSQMERMAMFMVLHNFLTPHRITGQANALECETHADRVGIGGKRIEWFLHRLTTNRHVYSHTSSAQWWIRRIWLHLHENPPTVTRRRGVTRERRVALGPAAVPRYLLA